MRYKMVFSYLGTNYYGYQIQARQNTVQGEIEKVFYKILQQDVTIYASGRTDRGVHAENQVAVFDLDKEIDTDKFKHSVNSLLPKDIYVKELTHCEDDFHARFSALGKKYVYKMSLKENDPLNNLTIYYANKEYDPSLIKEAMQLFIGTHDFKNFCTNKEELSYEETIYSFTLKKQDDILIFEIVGTGFKRYMVRMIIGTVLAYALHKITLEEIRFKLETTIRNNVSFKVPPEGLTLKEVYYKKEQINDKA